jgi:C2 domain
VKRPVNAVIVVIASVLVLIATLGGCKSDPADPPQDFCYVARSSNLKCKEPSDCDAQFGNTCKSLPLALSPSSLSAAKDCLESGVCGVASCVSRAAKNAAPTAAHKKLADDFCTFCAPTLEDCAANFYKRGSKSAGLAVLAYSEEVATAIDDGCTGQDGCQAKFQACAAGVIKDKIGTDVDTDTADCIVAAFSHDEGDTPIGPDGKPQAETCTAANCNGCCREDKCEKGDVTTGCGVGAKACTLCAGAQECLGGKCKEPCGPNNCPGCCDGDTCIAGSADDKCGEMGKACDRCTGQLNKCSNHTCIDGSCVATCTSGCCTTAGCQPGTAAGACGTGGEACINCGTGRKCSFASCTLDTTSLWDVYISFAFIPDKDKKGAAWDLLNGAPDPYLLVFTSEGTTSHSGETTSKTDTTAPFWQETPLKGVKASELISNTSIEIWDYDELNNDDFIGGCPIPLTPAMFDGSLLEVDCAPTATGGAMTIDYRIRPHVP